VLDGGRAIALGSGRQSLLLHCLLLQRGEVVSRDRLIDALWGERPPATAANALQVQVHSLRKRLGQQRIATEGVGYRLEVEPGELDLDRFERLVARGRSELGAGDAEEAASTLQEALALWRGPALADVAYEPFAQAEIARLEELRLVALEERIEAELALARHQELVPELEALVSAHTGRERLCGQLMLALYRSGRQTDALAVFRRARRSMQDELGLEPGPQLRDLQQAILRHDAVLRIESPDVRARRHLPAAETAIVGRRGELGEIGALLRGETTRLVTLTGAGGIGKTRLAVEIAHDLADAFADGVFFVDLAPLRDAALLPSAIARALRLEDRRSEQLVETIQTHLAARRVLLLLDNFEVVDEAAPLLSELLRGAPDLALLVTSRAPLRLSGEHVYRVQPLPIADAVQLFAARARLVAPSFRLVGEEADEVAQLCGRLDCLPLAIALAAARTRDYHPAELLDLAPRSLELATGGARDLPARQRTLRATIDWSYQLLMEEEQQSFCTLAVFAGGFGAAAAAAVCDTRRRALASLVGDSLLQERFGVGGEPRWYMLGTIREFALEQLGRSGDVDAYRARHAEHYVELAEVAEGGGASAEAEKAWVVLDQELDNLRAALAWSHEAQAVELELRLVGALAYYWSVREHLRDGLAAIEAALRRGSAGSAPVRAKALAGGSRLAESLGDYVRALAFAEESLAAYRSVGDRRGTARALVSLGVAAGNLGDRERCRKAYEEGAEIYRALDDQRGLAMVLNNVAYELIRHGEYDGARARCEEALVILDRLQLKARTVITLGNLGLAALLEGRLDEALDCFGQTLVLAAEVGYVEGSIYGLEGTAAVFAAAGRHELAGTILGAAQAAADGTGVELAPVEAGIHERTAAALRNELGETGLAEVVAAGRRLPLDDAAAYALRESRSAEVDAPADRV
jgi:predicted ATPase/DNA-binding SARP family transcriptional activator